MQHRYTLQPYRGGASRYACPHCNKPRIFCRYIDTETGRHLAPHVGRCNRIINCGYHYTPKQYFEECGRRTTDDRPQLIDNRRWTTDRGKEKRRVTDVGRQTADNGRQKNTSEAAVSTVVRGPSSMVNTPPSVVRGPSSFLSAAVLNQSLVSCQPNHFTTWLSNKFGAETMYQLRARYFIGASTHWPGATVFWQVDEQEHIRTGKIMLYNAHTGKRVKQPYNHITWVHTQLKQPAFNLQQCLFGQHLLAKSNQPIAIVESEKTALIASIYLPQFTWLAAGSLTNLTLQKCMPLKGRRITLFPDLNAYQHWCHKADELSAIATVTISDLLEHNCTHQQRKEGLDWGDYLVGFGVNEFKAI